MYNAGDVVVSFFPYADSDGEKARPAVVLFEDKGNIIMAGITSNPNMKGIPLTTSEGMVVNSVIKTNYIYTTSETFIKKRVTVLSIQKRKALFEAMVLHLNPLKVH